MTLVRAAPAPVAGAAVRRPRRTRSDEEMLRWPRARVAWGATWGGASGGRSASAREPGAR